MSEWSCNRTCTIEIRHLWRFWSSGSETVDRSAPAFWGDPSSTLALQNVYIANERLLCFLDIPIRPLADVSRDGLVRLTRGLSHRSPAPRCISPTPTMKHYRVFLGAPPPASLYRNEGDFGWETFTATAPILDTSVFEAASRRISRLYENIIFAENDDEDIGSASDSNLLDVEHSSRAAETFITWPPTPNRTKDASESQVSSGLQESTMEETQETASYEYSDTSSIGRFPHFSFNLHTLRLVRALVEMAKSSRMKGSLNVNVLMAVLEVEGPDAVTIRKGREAGNQASILKMILGDEDGNVLKLTAWRDVAETWGIGTDAQPPIRRGDIVLFQSLSSFVARVRRA